MSKSTLSRLLKKRKETTVLLEKLASSWNADFSIQDSQGNWVWGPEWPEDQQARQAIREGEAVIGWVYGDISADYLAHLLSYLVNVEGEKKRVGQEVLDLYREINLIYNFSEKLSKALDAEMIAKIALQEVRQLIDADGGMVFFLPEQGTAMELLAEEGHFTFGSQQGGGLSAMTSLIAEGKAGIIHAPEPGIAPVMAAPGALIYAPLRVKHRLLGAILLGANREITYAAADLKLLTTVALQSAAAIESAMLFEKRIQEAREREEAIRSIHEVSTRFVPYEFISALGRERLTELALGDQVEREVTVFFSDIRGYTTLAESMTPEENFRFVNAFNGRMGPLIHAYKGFVNQYLGDGIMAIFPLDPTDALQAAIHMQRRIREYNQERQHLQRAPIKVGMGLHTGSLIMGIIGDEQRMEAATISDTVNTAARMEGLTKYFGADLLISGYTLQEIQEKEQYHFRYLGFVRVKGKTHPVEVYQCLDGEAPETMENKLITLPDFTEGMRLFYQQRFSAARQAFESVLHTDASDFAARRMVERILQFEQDGLPDRWTGVVDVEMK